MHSLLTLISTFTLFTLSLCGRSSPIQSRRNAAAAALETRQTSAGSFSITGFYDTGSPHSTLAIIRFSVSDTDGSSPISNVACSYSQAIQPTVATAPFGTICNSTADHIPEDTTVLFGLQVADNGYYLTVARTFAGSNTTDVGSVYLGDDVQTVVDTANPNGNYQRLAFDTEFDIPKTRTF